jgi:Uri superfamily endonuclease
MMLGEDESHGLYQKTMYNAFILARLYMAMVTKGAYCICIDVGDDLRVNIGALGLIEFHKGRYIYVGSALNGLDARVRRHLNTSKGSYNAIHWHIDYLLREESVRVEAAYVRFTDEKVECEIAGEVSHYGSGVKGFGCSDCRCDSHLFKVSDWDFLSDLNMVKREAMGSC